MWVYDWFTENDESSEAAKLHEDDENESNVTPCEECGAVYENKRLNTQHRVDLTVFDVAMLPHRVYELCPDCHDGVTLRIKRYDEDGDVVSKNYATYTACVEHLDEDCAKYTYDACQLGTLLKERENHS